MKTRTGLQLSEGEGVLSVANGGTGQSNLDNVTVGNAEKATQDANGKVIDTTYATKTEVGEAVNSKQDKTDNTLTTTQKTIVGAINENKSAIDNLRENTTKVSVGTTTTGAPGSQASVTNSGTGGNVVLDFAIPQGKQGPQGLQGERGIQGPQGPAGADGDGYLIKRLSSGQTGGISVGDTFGNMSISSLNRTPKIGEVFLFVGYGLESGIIPKQNGRSFVCIAEVTSITGDSFSCTVKSSIETTGKNGTTFTPSVDASGNLSWTNDGDKENPPTVNIKGDPGLTAEQIQMFQYLAQHMTVDKETGKVTFSLEIEAPSFNAVTGE